MCNYEIKLFYEFLLGTECHKNSSIIMRARFLVCFPISCTSNTKWGRQIIIIQCSVQIVIAVVFGRILQNKKEREMSKPNRVHSPEQIALDSHWYAGAVAAIAHTLDPIHHRPIWLMCVPECWQNMQHIATIDV